MNDRPAKNLPALFSFGALGQLAIVLLLVLLTGCGEGRPRRVPVAGRVLLDGKPLTHGVVRFVPAADRASVGMLDDQGRFRLTCFDGGDGAVLGHHRIEVAASEALAEESVRWHAPRKYADFQTSGLTAEIAGPTADLTIELSSHD